MIGHWLYIRTNTAAYSSFCSHTFQFGIVRISKCKSLATHFLNHTHILNYTKIHHFHYICFQIFWYLTLLNHGLGLHKAIWIEKNCRGRWDYQQCDLHSHIRGKSRAIYRRRRYLSTRWISIPCIKIYRGIF